MSLQAYSISEMIHALCQANSRAKNSRIGHFGCKLCFTEGADLVFEFSTRLKSWILLQILTLPQDLICDATVFPWAPGIL